MKIQEIAFSCYPVTDMARARTFYEGILGLTVTPWTTKWKERIGWSMILALEL
jgi:catechol 2,3-dioxygenase-like lactoylglutathione lyase family enzyme